MATSLVKYQCLTLALVCGGFLVFSPFVASGQLRQSLQIADGATPKATIQYDLAADILQLVAEGSDSSISFITNGAERIFISPSGQVGVGTTEPQQALTVAGTIQSSSGGFMFPDGSVQTSAAESGAGVILTPEAAEPSACNSANNGRLALTSRFTTCVCRESVGWVSTTDGTSPCSWLSYFVGSGTDEDPYRLPGESASTSSTSATTCDWYRLNATTDVQGVPRTPGPHSFIDSANNAVYRITPGGPGSAVNVFCDMTNNDGGWTLVLSNPTNGTGLDLTSNSATLPVSTLVQGNLNIDHFFTGSTQFRLISDDVEQLWVSENGTPFSFAITTKYTWTVTNTGPLWNNTGGPNWYWGEAGWNDYGVGVFNYIASGDCSGCFYRTLMLFGNGRSGFYNYGSNYRYERVGVDGRFSVDAGFTTRSIQLWAR